MDPNLSVPDMINSCPVSQSIVQRADLLATLALSTAINPILS